MEHIVFVDPFASAQYLASSLKQAGITTSVVYTIKRFTSEYFTFQPELFDNSFYLNEQRELSGLIKKLAALSVTRVYCGSEMSVGIADHLANALCPDFANNPATSYCRS